MQYLLKEETTNQSKYNSYLLFAFIGITVYGVLSYDWYYTLAITIFLHQFCLLYLKLGERIPIRNIAGTMFSLNYLFSPVLMYKWLDPFSIEILEMKVDPETYFTYAVPAIILFLIGLNIFGKREEEEIDIEEVRSVLDRYPSLPIQLIMVGIVASVLNSKVPSSLSLFVGIITYLKHIGFFLSLLSRKGFNLLYFLLSYGIIVIESIASSMFNDFLNMLFFLGFFFCLRYKPSHIFKIAGIFAGVLLIAFIQMIKAPLRSKPVNPITQFDKFVNTVKESQANSNAQKKEEKILNVVTRINQGWFTSSTIGHYKKGGFKLQDGKHSIIVLKTATLPKFLAPDRYDIGDPTLFNKFSGYYVAPGSSMALGILSDGYIDFGMKGVIVVFLFGLVLNLFIKLYHKMNDVYKLAKVFAPVCFFYAIRPDTDTQGAIGGLIKVTIIIWVMLVIVNKYYSETVSLEEEEE